MLVCTGVDVNGTNPASAVCSAGPTVSRLNAQDKAHVIRLGRYTLKVDTLEEALVLFEDSADVEAPTEVFYKYLRHSILEFGDEIKDDASGSMLARVKRAYSYVGERDPEDWNRSSREMRRMLMAYA